MSIIYKIIKFFINLTPLGKVIKEVRQELLGKLPITIRDDTRCLLIAPHPDDETIGCGGVLLKYANHFDCVCMASSGVAYENLSAEYRADLRISEFETVMNAVGIENYWIFKTFGKPPMIGQIKRYVERYAEVLDFKQYDYIFMPSPVDNHTEHKFITNELVKKLISKNGFKQDTKIVFYEVWTPISYPSYFEDISDVMEAKKDLIRLYKSCLVKIDYVKRTEGLNCYRGVFANNCDFAEAFKVISIKQYLSHDKF